MDPPQQETPYLDALCVRNTLELGGSVRGASDRLLHTVRVVLEPYAG